MTPWLGLCLIVTAALSARAAVFTEDFAVDPGPRGWKVFGDASLFHWNSTNQNLEVTWDSSRSNSFFCLPFGNLLAKSDDFSFSFDLRLQDIRAGSTPGKSNEFEIAVGLLNLRNATNAGYFRGAGVSPTLGIRNVMEFDYFPDAGFGDTWATTVVSTNNVFAFAHNFPLTLSLGDLFRITLSFSSADQMLRTTATRNGTPFGPLEDVSVANTPDFRLDAFGVVSYNDAVQLGSPAFHGSVLAHGTVDNVTLVLPPPPVEDLSLSRDDTAWSVTFQSRTNWLYILERSAGLNGWNDASAPTPGTGSRLVLPDETNGSDTAMFYRVRAERP